MAAAAQLLDAPRRRSEERLARRATGGDRDAFGAIFERYQQELYRFCLGLLGEPQDAQDALQNTMVKALRALPGEEREIALRPWLYRIAHNEAIELRRSRRDSDALDGHLLDARSNVVEKAEQRERLQWVLKDLGDLPERQRAALVMRELSGLDFADIGAALGTSGAVVRQALYEARRNLEQMDRGRSLRCETVARVLSDADGRVSARREIRAHLRDCPECRRFKERIRGRKEVLAGIAPLPVGAAASILQGTVGAGASSAGGLAATLGAGGAQSIGTGGALKALATVAAVAAVGTATVEHGLPAHRAAAGDAAGPSASPDRPRPAAGPVAAAARPRRDGVSALRAAPWRGGETSGVAPGVLGARHPASPPRAPVAVAGADVAAPPAEPGQAVRTVAVGTGEGRTQPPGQSVGEGARGEPTQAPRQPESGAARADGAAQADGSGDAERTHPEHPPHPAQSRKPAAEDQAGADGAGQEVEAAPVSLAAEPPVESEPGPEATIGSSHGKAKGKEKQVQD